MILPDSLKFSSPWNMYSDKMVSCISFTRLVWANVSGTLTKTLHKKKTIPYDNYYTKSRGNLGTLYIKIYSITWIQMLCIDAYFDTHRIVSYLRVFGCLGLSYDHTCAADVARTHGAQLTVGFNFCC